MVVAMKFLTPRLVTIKLIKLDLLPALLLCFLLSLSFQSVADDSIEITAESASFAFNAYKEGNYADALRIWRQMAKSGDAAAQNNLGMMYFHSKGVEQDLAEANKWFQESLNQGYIFAKLNLGIMYARGQGVEKNIFYAYQLLSEAAALEVPRAQQNLDNLCQDNAWLCEFSEWD